MSRRYGAVRAPMARKARRRDRRRGWAASEPLSPVWLGLDEYQRLGYRPEPFDWRYVRPGLATGGMPTTREEVDYLVDCGITHIVNCADELRDKAAVAATDPRITYLWNPTPDNGAWKDPEWFAATIAFAVPAIKAGGSVLIHCVMGSNRGPSSAYAVLRVLGAGPVDAERQVRNARPKARLLYVPDAEAALKVIL